MSNYVRAVFCVNHPIQTAQFYNMLERLECLNCRYNFWMAGEVSGYLEPDNQVLDIKEKTLDQDSIPSRLQQLAVWLATPGYLAISLGWRVGDKQYPARITRTWRGTDRVTLTFDVDDSAFLSGHASYTPDNDDATYHAFKRIIIEITRKTKPMIGVVDEEADLLCDRLEQFHSLASWGNYFSMSMLRQWSRVDLEALLQIVDEHTKVNDLGILTFLHPLAANQAWDIRHERVHALIQCNPSMGE